MTALFPGDSLVDQLLLIVRRDFAVVRQKHIHSFILGKNCGSDTAFTTTENYNLLIHSLVLKFFYRIFNVTKVITASIMPTIQNRVTILDSGMGMKGR